jgi:hypothetical protein
VLARHCRPSGPVRSSLVLVPISCGQAHVYNYTDMHSGRALPVLLVFLLAASVLAGQDDKKRNDSKGMFTFQGPGAKTTLVGFFYSADDEEALSLAVPKGNEVTIVSVPFRRIKRLTLARGGDRFSIATLTRSDGSTVTGHLANLTVLFIDPKRDKPYDLPLSDPDNYLADQGNRQQVNCALGTFTQRQ